MASPADDFIAGFVVSVVLFVIMYFITRTVIKKNIANDKDFINKSSDELEKETTRRLLIPFIIEVIVAVIAGVGVGVWID